MSRRSALVLTWAPMLFGLVAGTCYGAKPTAQGVDFFEKQIRPVLVAQCYECHSSKSKIVQANLYLDSREGMRRGGDSGPAVVPGNSEESLVVEALRYQSLEMPPSGKLADEVVANFTKWIEMGAADPRDGKPPKQAVVDVERGRGFWAYQRPRRSPTPHVKHTAWPRNEIDRFVLARLESQGLAPSPDAEPRTLVRRLYLDLIGLPPTPQEVDSFVASISSSSGDRVYESLVDELLASPRFGERWGRHWLDLARYAESSGKERNVPYRMAWRYRDYVIDCFNADVPYDRFIIEQLAGDLLPSASTAERDRQLIATGFLSIGPRTLTERIVEKDLLDVADEQLDTTCRTFLATTAACARCHDHKFDPIPTTDYYGLIGIFRSTENVNGVAPQRREFSYARAGALGDEHVRNGAGKTLVEEIRALEAESDRLNSAYRAATKAKDAAALEQVKLDKAATAKRLLEARTRAETDDPGAPRYAMFVRDREPADYALRIRGEVDDLGPIVPRGYLSVMTDDKSPKIDRDASGRLELARWIASADNPLTARVMVNRLWHHLFGRGLVATTEDFGSMGERPTHPELLDYLALKFVDDGWSIKRALRAMVLSRVYRQSSNPPTEAEHAGSRTSAATSAREIDPDNRFLWRFDRRRLDAEVIRDAMLAASGDLSLERPFASASLKLDNIELGSEARNMAGDDSPRYRAVYLPVLRGAVPEMLGLFDMADPSLVVGARESTTVATQALYLMNSRFIMDRSRRFAERAIRDTEGQREARVDLIFRLALARSPSPEELRNVIEFVERAQAADEPDRRTQTEAWSDVCHAVLTCAEFLSVR